MKILVGIVYLAQKMVNVMHHKRVLMKRKNVALVFMVLTMYI